RKNPPPKLCRSGNTPYPPILISENHLPQSRRVPARPQIPHTRPRRQAKILGNQSFALMTLRAPDFLTHERRGRVCRHSRTIAQSLLEPWPIGQTSRNSGSPQLNQSTGYPISFANTRLPRLTGSRSFHSRNFAPLYRAVQTGPALKPARAICQILRVALSACSP